jgi:hypothetical protein
VRCVRIADASLDLPAAGDYFDAQPIATDGDAGGMILVIEVTVRGFMKTSRMLCALVIASMLLTASCSTCPCKKADGRGGRGRVSLFDGKTLAGWTVLKCEATVDDGDILIVAGNGLVQTEKKYGDFVLEFEWKPLKESKWDSGVYFRYDSVPQGKPWPERYQANLLQGQEGNVSDLPEARSTGLIQAGQWNRFKLTVQGTKASLEINGTRAWETDGLAGPAAGYISLQAEVPGGGQHRFRNIYLTEMK